MGQTNGVFSEKEMEDFEEYTFLKRREIKLVFKEFRNLDYQAVSMDRKCELPMEVIQNSPRLKVNPFRKRICQVFSHNGSGAMTFIDFLDMISVFSAKSPLQIKLEYAFRIYDFDNDNVIRMDDIKKTMMCLSVAQGLREEDQLTEEQMELLIETVIKEASIDTERGINFEEFSIVLKKIPYFFEYFQMRL